MIGANLVNAGSSICVIGCPRALLVLFVFYGDDNHKPKPSSLRKTTKVNVIHHRPWLQATNTNHRPLFPNKSHLQRDGSDWKLPPQYLLCVCDSCLLSFRAGPFASTTVTLCRLVPLMATAKRPRQRKEATRARTRGVPRQRNDPRSETRASSLTTQTKLWITTVTCRETDGCYSHGMETVRAYVCTHAHTHMRRNERSPSVLSLRRRNHVPQNRIILNPQAGPKDSFASSRDPPISAASPRSTTSFSNQSWNLTSENVIIALW